MIKPKLPGLSYLTPPLERVCVKGLAQKVWLVRLDLLPYGGGNKVIRVLGWLQRRHWPGHVVAMSDAGSNSFLTLLNLMECGEFGMKKLTLLCRGNPQSKYAENIQAKLLGHPHIRIIKGPVLLLWLRFILAKILQRSVLPIGGATDAGMALDQAMFEKVQAFISDQTLMENPYFTHTLPVSSGVLLSAIHHGSKKINCQIQTQNQIAVQGLYTGTAPGWFYYWQKLRLRGKARFLKAPKPGLGFHKNVATQPFVSSFLSLDPVHMLPCFLWLQNNSELGAKKADSNVQIVWVTCPKI